MDWRVYDCFVVLEQDGLKPCTSFRVTAKVHPRIPFGPESMINMDALTEYACTLCLSVLVMHLMLVSLYE